MPESVMIVVKSAYDGVIMNFTCYASEVYPEPKIMMYTDKKENIYAKCDNLLCKILILNNFYILYWRNPLEAVEWSTSRLNNGRYSVTVITSVLASDLNSGTLIHCELRIPGTGYMKRKTMLYYPPGMNIGIVAFLFLLICCSHTKILDKV